MRRRELDDGEVQVIRHGLEHVSFYAGEAWLRHVSHLLLMMLDLGYRVTLDGPDEARPTEADRLMKIRFYLRAVKKSASRGWERFEREKMHPHVLVYMEKIAGASFGILGDLEEHSPQILWGMIEDAAIRNQYPTAEGALDAGETWELLQMLGLTEKKIEGIRYE